MTTSLAGYARERLEQARSTLTELGKQMDAELRAATVYADDTLSQSGLQDKRFEMKRTIREKYRAQFEALRDVVKTDVESLRKGLEAQRPKIADDAPSLMRAQTKWDQVRMRLEAGMPMTKIIAAADSETALAIREWAPAWLEAQAYAIAPGGLSGEVPVPDIDALLRSLDDRLTEIHGDDFRTAVSHARYAEEAIAGITPMLEHRLLESASGNPTSGGLGAAIAGAVAAQQAAARYVDPTPQPEGATA